MRILSGRVLLAAGGICLAAAALALAALNPRLTAYIKSPAFRAELDKQTSKGLHFEGQYGPIKRTGFLTAATDEFHARKGVKAMKNLDASGIMAKFNPLGVFLRRWQLDSVRIERGRVEIQTYEPKPEQKPGKPWYAIFLPERVYLREVTCPNADVTWQLRGRESGIYGTKVRIIPYGRDFEYFASGGVLKTSGLTPELRVAELHLVITKTILRLYALELLTKEAGGTIRATGEMGMRDDKHVDARIEFKKLLVAPWLPDEISAGIRGVAEGSVRWEGADQTIEASFGQGRLEVSGGEIVDLPLLDFLAAATARKSLETVKLTECRVTFRWKYPRFEIVSIDLAAEEKVALRGSLVVTKPNLSGELDLGLAPTYLDWLPKARQEIFTREEDGLVWTKVRISGTLAKPVDDLTPRLASVLRKDPAAAAGLLLRGVGEWLEQKFKFK